MLRTHPASARVRQVAPPLLVLGLAVSSALAVTGAPGAAALPLGYLGLLAAGSVEADLRRRDPLAVVLVPVVLATMHLVWGVGFLSSMAAHPQRRGVGTPGSRRLPLSSFGKRSLLARMAAGLFFTAQAAVHGIASRRPGVVLLSTAPPIGVAAALVVWWLRGVPICYWIHDLQPDLAIELGVMKHDSLAARLLERLNRGTACKRCALRFTRRRHLNAIVPLLEGA